MQWYFVVSLSVLTGLAAAQMYGTTAGLLGGVLALLWLLAVPRLVTKKSR
jgi:hypothetical protein